MKRWIVRTGLSLLVAFPPVSALGQTAAQMGADEKIGDFFLIRETDGFDDSHRSRVVTFSGQPPFDLTALSWGCTSKGVAIIAAFGSYFAGEGGRVSVRYRFDSKTPSDLEDWLLLSSTAAGLPDGRQSDFTRQALPALSVLFEFVDPFDGESVRERFSLIGLRAALSKLECARELLAPPRSEGNPDDIAPTSISPPEVPGPSGDLRASPTFTPFTVAPLIQNRQEVVRAMIREYPPLLRDAGLGGTVIVYFFIDENGIVREARIHESSGHRDLNQAALAVAEVYQFSPAENRGERVPVWVQFPITFGVR